MELSVIIPTRNRYKLLKKVLESLKKQTLDKDLFEVLIIDNGSTDETKSMCDEFKKDIKNLRYFYDDRPGLHTGRNLGFLKSKSELLVYGDDDITVPNNWLESILMAFKNPEVVLVGGNDIPEYEISPEEWVNNLWTSDGKGNRLLLPFSCIDMGTDSKFIPANYVFGCNFSIRKSILEITKGFHPDGMPDEFLCFRGDGETYVSEYIMKNNLKALFLPEASVNHFVSQKRMTYEYVNKINYRNGISEMYNILRKHNSLLRAYLLYFSLLRDRNSNYATKGKIFLLKEYIKSKKLRKWIVLPDYLNVNIKDFL